MNRPAVSIVVPVYNTEAYLRCCVDSVLNQSFKDYELILIDDGSTDRSGSICDEYAARDCRVSVLHRERSGQGKARNTGMAEASGKYMIFLDSDDYWAPSALETLYAEAERNQTQVLLFAGRRVFDGFEETGADPRDRYRMEAQNHIVKTGAEILKKGLDCGEYYSEPFLRFCRLDYLRSKGLCFDEGIIHEDVVFSFLACLFAERAECIGDRLYYYRIRPGSTMNEKAVGKHARGHHVCFRRLLDLWLTHSLSAEQNLLLERYCIIRIRKICSFYIDTIEQDGWKDARVVEKEMAQVMKKARVLPSLPFRFRIASHSLFLFYIYIWFRRKLSQQIPES